MEIETLIGRLDEIISRGGTPASMADAYFQRGKLYWKAGRRGEAMSDYARAEELDPGSPAAEALAQARAIMQFYNKDLYNP